MKDDKKANVIAERLSTPRGRRFLAWTMMQPMLMKPNPLQLPVGPWEDYPDSPKGTLEVWDEKSL